MKSWTPPAAAAVLTLLPQAVPSAAAYVWPSKWDHLEDITYLLGGYIRFGFIDAINPCSFDTGIPGRQNSAEWLRTAFHDMATHDAATGMGGLDASIMFETHRPENPGSAFDNTFGFFSGYYTGRTSASDLLALAVVTSTSVCGGQRIPLMYGRIDATEAGPSGVPEPNQDLETHIGKFARMGLTEEEMIKSVACGHSLGGIHGTNFPDITGNSSEANVERFDTSFAALDEAVVTEYLDASSQNLLVAGSNDTLNSDKRVFGADGNVTMQALSDPSTFQSECAAVFEKMINTVPSSVALSGPLDPVDVKPYITNLLINSDGSLGFAGRIRVRTSAVTGRQYDDLGVQLKLKDREGNDGMTLGAQRPTYKLGQSSGLWGEIFTWFEFSGSVSPSTGISGFDVVMWTLSTNTSEVFNNGGDPFPVQDDILYLKEFSCLSLGATDEDAELTVVAAVKIDKIGLGGRIDMEIKTPRQGVVLPAITTESHALESTGFQYAGYEWFRVELPLAQASWRTRFDVVLGEGDAERKVDFLDTSSLRGATCQPIPGA